MKCFAINRHLPVFILILAAGLLLQSCKNEVREGDKAWNDAVAPFRKSVDVGGYTLHYIDIGSGDPVLMIHGFADSDYTWHENYASLTKAGFRLIMVDQPGMGRSDAPPQPYTYSIENQTAAIIKLTEIIHLRRFSIIGHSMGGGIALHIMINHPGRVIRAVVIDPVCLGPHNFQILTMPGMKSIAPKLGGRWAVRSGLEDAFFDSDLVDDAMVDECYRPFNRPEYYDTLIALEKEFFSPAFEKMTQSFGQIQKPVLIIWGEKDTWVYAGQGTTLADKISGSTLRVIDKCGHKPHQEYSDTVNALLVDFLKNGS